MKDFRLISQQMIDHGMKVPDRSIHFRITDAKPLVIEGLKFFTGKDITWLPEYDKVSEWLENNEGRGLFLFGDCGRGKSLLSRYVIPAILLSSIRLVVSVYDMAEIKNHIDEVAKKKIISLDDVGVEDVIVTYGERRMPFSEIMDSVEKQSKLIIITTNLKQDELKLKYGDRVLDRIISTTTRIQFKGKSMRV